MSDTERSEKRSEAVLRLARQLHEIQGDLIGVKNYRKHNFTNRLFMVAGLSLEALSVHLGTLEKSGALPSGWRPSKENERRPESDQG
jgi:hypothetical protein